MVEPLRGEAFHHCVLAAVCPEPVYRVVLAVALLVFLEELKHNLRRILQIHVHRDREITVSDPEPRGKGRLLAEIP